MTKPLTDEKHRKLIIVPTVHGEADMGSLGEKLREAQSHDWADHQRQINAFWERIRQALEKLDVDYQRVRIYQDGLPCGGEAARRLVTEVAEKGSVNYQIVQEMLARGATIEQTEDPELLKEEYLFLKQEANAQTPEHRRQLAYAHGKRQAELLSLRDRFMARRVATTLQPGEVGILFVGALHEIVSQLPDDIEVHGLPSPGPKDL